MKGKKVLGKGKNRETNGCGHQTFEKKLLFFCETKKNKTDSIQFYTSPLNKHQVNWRVLHEFEDWVIQLF